MTHPESLEFLLFSGAYDRVLARSAQHYEDAEAPAVIGALALSGRLEEAESVFASFARTLREADGVAQARFFVLAGLCHAGRINRALAHAREGLASLGVLGSRRRFWVFQGLALIRYFEGRFRHSRRLARRALDAAIAASFPYARFLALDLLAHVSLQTGEVFAGLRLLSQAEALAEALGYEGNASNQRTAHCVFELRLLLTDVDSALAAVKDVVEAPEVSYFTQRNGLIELATMQALAGKASQAMAALEAARRIALPGTDQRGKTRWLLGHALCAGLSEGRAHAESSLVRAREAAGESLTLRAEVGFVELAFLGERSPEALRSMQELADRTGIQRLTVALDVARGRTGEDPSRFEDGLCRVLLECVGKSERERVEVVLQSRLYGLSSWALEREPGKLIILTERVLISDNEGEVTVAELPSRPAVKLLLALRHGYKSRAELLSEVWEIARFVPSRHAAVLHTTVSRLRTALGVADFVVTHDDGYSLLERVEVINFAESRQALASMAPSAPSGDVERVAEFIQHRGRASSAEVAQALKLSPSTALRLLRRLADEGRLKKTGAGRNTRYEIGGARPQRASDA